jgi:hypothetical protein
MIQFTISTVQLMYASCAPMIVNIPYIMSDIALTDDVNICAVSIWYVCKSSRK